MNKYQKSLDFIATCIPHRLRTGKLLLRDSFIKLQELVSKATPKKPHLEGDGYDNKGNLIYDTWICPNCFVHFEVDYDDYDYCPCCGQALDMSEVRNESESE